MGVGIGGDADLPVADVLGSHIVTAFVGNQGKIFRGLQQVFHYPADLAEMLEISKD